MTGRWRGAEAERAEFGSKWFAPDVGFPTLGFVAAEWVEANCVIPDGPDAGSPYVLTDEMVRFLVHFYRVDPHHANAKTGGPAWAYPRGGQLVRPQKWGKGPFSAAVILFEACGPALPAGFDALGRLGGRPWPTPWVQVTAVSEDQVQNVFRALLPMIELGRLAADVDSGLTRVNLPNGGVIQPVTASGRSRLGQRATMVLQDESHSWLPATGGHALADNQRRNVAGMGGRFLETTNAWDISEGSVAQATNEHPVGVYVDYPLPPPGSVTNKAERRRVLRKVYGDSVHAPAGAGWKPWVDLDRVDLEIEALVEKGEAGQAERFFLNRAHQGATVAFDLDGWARAYEPGHVVPDGALVTLGVDGARYDDALAVVATEVASAYQWPVCVVERPPNAGPGYEHDLDFVDAQVAAVFDRLDVWRLYVDPQYIEKLVDRWLGRWTKDRVVEWFTGRSGPNMPTAVRVYAEAVARRELTHDGDSVMARHVANARRRPSQAKDPDGRPMWTIQKERPGSPNKIDAAMAGVLSLQARNDAVAAGVLERVVRPQWFMGV